jgi:hypothetical protein
LAGGLLVAALASPVARNFLEASMITHMLVQLPLLVAAGILFAQGLPGAARNVLQGWNDFGVPGITLAIAVSSYWMLPRVLDASLATPLVEGGKFLALPFLAGVPLALSWNRLSPIVKGFVLANWIPMLGVLGWLYRESPVRLCNYYLADQQVETGDALLYLTAILGLVWLTTLFWRPDLWARSELSR